MAKSFQTLIRQTMTPAARQKAKRRAREIMTEMFLKELRDNAGCSQRHLAKQLGIAQPTLARMETQSDMQLTTLRRIIEALGGRLEVHAVFRGKKVAIAPFHSTATTRIHSSKLAG